MSGRLSKRDSAWCPEPGPDDATLRVNADALRQAASRALHRRPRRSAGARGPAATAGARAGPGARAEPTSDVTRFRGVLAAAVSRRRGLPSVAALALPGRRGWPAAPRGHPLAAAGLAAGLACAACHTGAGPGDRSAPPAAAACTTCHGAHATRRRGHAAALASGAMTCATCHPIHRSDQGVAFAPDGPALRFAPGAEAELRAGSFHPVRPVTVAIPTLGSCAPCHRAAAPSDPIARCLVGGQEALGDARPIVCFDEHAPALPPDEGRRDRDPRRRARAPASTPRTAPSPGRPRARPPRPCRWCGPRPSRARPRPGSVQASRWRRWCSPACAPATPCAAGESVTPRRPAPCRRRRRGCACRRSTSTPASAATPAWTPAPTTCWRSSATWRWWPGRTPAAGSRSASSAAPTDPSASPTASPSAIAPAWAPIWRASTSPASTSRATSPGCR